MSEVSALPPLSLMPSVLLHRWPGVDSATHHCSARLELSIVSAALLARISSHPLSASAPPPARLRVAPLPALSSPQRMFSSAPDDAHVCGSFVGK
ncbi:hypothetical protein B0H14DRAFT_3448545 [Mycena olivaceomarginata]|nr:hypothetical protein B0H14DRAFT_3448545 [Mycena olivaceomarginata]